jgi:M-phase inducer tyrosine phosphatase
MLLNGDFDAHLASFALIDCRFSYEYDGGKLKGSQSLCDPARVEEQFLWSPSKDCKRTALIFYCEFSANRAPKMYVFYSLSRLLARL